MGLTDATTLGQSGPGSNGNERVHHIFPNSESAASPSDSLVSNPEPTLEKGYFFTLLLRYS